MSAPVKVKVGSYVQHRQAGEPRMTGRVLRKARPSVGAPSCWTVEWASGALRVVPEPNLIVVEPPS